MNGELLEIIAPATVMGLVIALVHGPLGVAVLRRGIIFIDLAVAQIAGLGLVVVSQWYDEPPVWLLQVTALTFALIAGGFFRWIEKIAPQHQEAIIGCGFVLAASVAILVLANQPGGGEELQHLLAGQILFITWRDLLVHGPIYALILLVWLSRPSAREGISFYLLFALAITSSVQLVGVYVVFASLIMPALTAAKTKPAYTVAWICGIVAVLSGITVATLLDLPAGPALVVCYSLVALTIALLIKQFCKSGLVNG